MDAMFDGVKALFGMGINSVLKPFCIDPKTVTEIVENFDLSKLYTILKNGFCKVYFGLVKCSPCKPELFVGLLMFRTLLNVFKNMSGDAIIGLNFIGAARKGVRNVKVAMTKF